MGLRFCAVWSWGAYERPCKVVLAPQIEADIVTTCGTLHSYKCIARHVTMSSTHCHLRFMLASSSAFTSFSWLSLSSSRTLRSLSRLYCKARAFAVRASHSSLQRGFNARGLKQAAAVLYPQLRLLRGHSLLGVATCGRSRLLACFLMP